MVEFEVTPEFQKPEYRCEIVEEMFGKGHPFQTATATYHDFAKQVGELRKLPDDKLRQVVDRMYDLLDDVATCCACYAKACSFGEIIAGRRLPNDRKRFGELLDERVAAQELEKRGSTGDRDFREEVRYVIKLCLPGFDFAS